MPRIKTSLGLLPLFVTLITPVLEGRSVSSYKPFAGTAVSLSDHRLSLVLRKFRLDGRTSYLLLDPSDLRTAIRSESEVRVAAAPRKVIADRFAGSVYFKALDDAAANAAAVQNAGLTHLMASPPGIALTVDLCPSRKPLDRGLFTDLVREFGKEEKPVPVAVAVTGVWMDSHGPDLKFLQELEKSGDIAVTWINHTYHHHWTKSRPLKENFLLEKGTDVSAEILRTEAAMIERDLTPSIFFRFPGLVSSRELVLTVESFGLVPVGSDAWLGKNQWPKEGSIVLVHANGNEPFGIARFMKLIREERDKIVHGQWLLLDLRAAAAAQERKREPL